MSKNSKKFKQRHELYRRLLRTDVIMPQCSRCSHRGFLCKVGKKFSRCVECVRSLAKCDCRDSFDVEWRFLKQQENALEEKMRLTVVRANELH
jgi:hypothetical protein